MYATSHALLYFLLLSANAHAVEALDAEAVRQLVTGNTVHGLRADGETQKNYFAPDGRTYRQIGSKIIEGTWRVNDDGTQCVDGMPGGCARIVKNGDGTYERVTTDGRTRLKWSAVVKGKDF